MAGTSGQGDEITQSITPKEGTKFPFSIFFQLRCSRHKKTDISLWQQLQGAIGKKIYFSASVFPADYAIGMFSVKLKLIENQHGCIKNIATNAIPLKNSHFKLRTNLKIWLKSL